MMSNATDRLGLPLLAAGQSQKEVTHNAALTQLDMLMQSAVVAAFVTAPPAAPQPGQCWIVGRGATGAWAGQDDALAQYSGSGWRFRAAFDGLSVWNMAAARPLRFTGGRWSDALDASALRIGGKQVVGAQQPAIPAPSGGTTPDVQARAAITAVLSALQAHGLISG
jgi:hypothetical protein